MNALTEARNYAERYEGASTVDWARTCRDSAMMYAALAQAEAITAAKQQCH